MQWFTPANPVVGFTQDFRWNRILVVECLRQDLRHLQIVSVDIRQMVAVTESETPDLRCMSHQGDPYDGAGINIIDEQASPARLRTSSATRSTSGISRRARKIPPGPMVSEEHIVIPYFNAVRVSIPR